jgi:hypothetical protein
MTSSPTRTAQEPAYIIWESFNPPTNSSSGRQRADRVAEASLTEASQAPQEAEIVSLDPQEAEYASLDLNDVCTVSEIQRQVPW